MTDPLLVDYWKVTEALGQAMNEIDDSLVFWVVIKSLSDAIPNFDWRNAVTDHMDWSP